MGSPNASLRPTESSPNSSGPYSGRLARALGHVPQSLRNTAVDLGGITTLLMTTLRTAIRHPTGYWGAVLAETYSSLRRATLPATVAVVGFLVFMSIMVIINLRVVGAQTLYPPMVTQFSAQSFTVWVNSTVVIGVVGAGVTADIGARKVREEIDAMEIMGVAPIRELVLPRLLSITIIMTVWSVPSMLVTITAATAGGIYVGDISPEYFFHDLFRNLNSIDIYALVINSFLIGLMVGAVCCYKGLTAAGGALGLGKAVNQAVVISFVSFWMLQLVYQALVISLFPNLGAYR